MTPTWKIQLLYDGACPLCLREVNFLRRCDQGRGLISCVDVTDDHYDPAEHAGIEFATAMERIHALLPDGQVVQNVEAFRRVYEILGMGWVYAITRVPGIGWMADKLYGLWADQRLRMTGRPSLKTILAEREQRQCETNRCRV
jgi:predicted DCC family thiol-disulfide oxidoreductase YuxK